MDKSEDTKKLSAIPAAAGDPADAAATPPAGPAAAGETGVESKIELASIDSPAMAPTMSDMAAEAAGLDTAQIARAISRPNECPMAEKLEEIKPKGSDDAVPGSRDIIHFGGPAAGRSSRRFSKFTLLAASVVLAAAFGATAGVLGATGLTRLVSALAGAPAPAPQPLAAEPALQTTLTQLRAEVAALKASVDATGRNAGAQYSKLVERFDRVERAQSGAGKSDAALPKETAKDMAKETTGSIAPTAVPPAPVPAPSSATVPGWAVRDVYRGVAMLQSRVGGMVEVEAGDVLPGLGRIEAIRRQDGHWVVVTSKGTITSLR
jgi:hypothetical protein